MQIYAFDSGGALTHTLQASRNASYQCPECSAPVRLRGGPLRKLHFYHLETSPCRLHGKSLIHLHIQYALQKRLGEGSVLLEHRFPEIRRVADVVWPSQKLIFEVQVSPISAAEIKERNRDYALAGYQVVWILHDRQFNRTQMTAAEIALRDSPHYFTDINRFGKGFFYDQYAARLFKRRIKRSRRFPIRIGNLSPVNLKQLPRHFPEERKKWNLSFEGDLMHHPCAWQEPEKKRVSIFQTLGRLYSVFFNLLLEKTTD